MKRTILVRLFAGLLALTGAWVAYTQTPQGKQAPAQTKAPAPFNLIRIADDLYVIDGGGAGNVAVYITNEGVIMVDDKFEQHFDEIMANVKKVTNQPVKYILSTHYHADHSGGNTRWSSIAEIISTRNAHDGIVQHKQSNAPDNMIPARVTFTQETDLFLGGKEVRAKYYGRGHTNGDAFVYFPALKVLHTGDMFTSATPLIDYPGGGSLVEWTKTLDSVMADKSLDFDTVIPGHGPVSKKADLLTYRNNAEKMRTRVQTLIRQGKKQDDVAKVMTAEYNWQPGSLNMQWSLPGMMTELK
ncbi:MAG: MBL fold metallo-hydrolase [Acidobacteriia bacterium]|nr:MBL fold metallo-hydrolase [Terriglobia bacterium]